MQQLGHCFGRVGLGMCTNANAVAEQANFAKCAALDAPFIYADLAVGMHDVHRLTGPRCSATPSSRNARRRPASGRCHCQR